ncbi:hypothetical protein HMN09_01072800 [Mycena chlorophos]|uniref:AAA+ ATPase domain-containing protein n=1 Tax=Mycena chlorophos TaxID=658473 RepID=A0A8H6SBT5_MYCCL|nr:hypothetical protein HMN09_01072800 [Mycena chlorophos]
MAQVYAAVSNRPSHSILARSFPFDAVPASLDSTLLQASPFRVYGASKLKDRQRKSRELVTKLDARASRDQWLVYNLKDISKAIRDTDWFVAKGIEAVIWLAETRVSAPASVDMPAVRIPSLVRALHDETVQRFAALGGDGWQKHLLRASSAAVYGFPPWDSIVLNLCLVQFGMQWMLINGDGSRLPTYQEAFEYLQAIDTKIKLAYRCAEALLIPLRMYLLSPFLLLGSIDWTKRTFRLSTMLIVRWSSGKKPAELVKIESLFHRVIVHGGSLVAALFEAERMYDGFSESMLGEIGLFFADPRDPKVLEWPSRAVEPSPVPNRAAEQEQDVGNCLSPVERLTEFDTWSAASARLDWPSHLTSTKALTAVSGDRVHAAEEEEDFVLKQHFAEPTQASTATGSWDPASQLPGRMETECEELWWSEFMAIANADTETKSWSQYFDYERWDDDAVHQRPNPLPSRSNSYPGPQKSPPSNGARPSLYDRAAFSSRSVHTSKANSALDVPDELGTIALQSEHIAINVHENNQTSPKHQISRTSREQSSRTGQSELILDVERIPAHSRETTLLAEWSTSYVGGCKEQIEKLREVVETPLLSPQRFVNLGIDPPKGMMLYGPPGTGKTLCARAVANRTDAPSSFSLAPNSSTSTKKACTIFFDEVDAIGGPRFDDSAGGDNEVQQAMLELIDQLDGFDPEATSKYLGPRTLALNTNTEQESRHRKELTSIELARDQLETALVNMRSSHDHANEEVGRLGPEVKTLKAALQMSKQYSDDLRCRITLLKNRSDNVANQSADADRLRREEQEAELKAQLEEGRRKEVDLESKVQHLDAQLVSKEVYISQAALNQAEAKYIALKKIHDDTVLRLKAEQESKRDAQREQREKRQLGDQLAHARNREEELQEDIKSKVEEIETLKEERDHSESLLREMEKREEEAQIVEAQLRQDVDSQQIIIATLKNENGRGKTKVICTLCLEEYILRDQNDDLMNGRETRSRDVLALGYFNADKGSSTRVWLDERPAGLLCHHASQCPHQPDTVKSAAL